jgi:hypothetical protein
MTTIDTNQMQIARQVADEVSKTNRITGMVVIPQGSSSSVPISASLDVLRAAYRDSPQRSEAKYDSSPDSNGYQGSAASSTQGLEANVISASSLFGAMCPVLASVMSSPSTTSNPARCRQPSSAQVVTAHVGQSAFPDRIFAPPQTQLSSLSSSPASSASVAVSSASVRQRDSQQHPGPEQLCKRVIQFFGILPQEFIIFSEDSLRRNYRRKAFLRSICGQELFNYIMPMVDGIYVSKQYAKMTIFTKDATESQVDAFLAKMSEVHKDKFGIKTAVYKPQYITGIIQNAGRNYFRMKGTDGILDGLSKMYGDIPCDLTLSVRRDRIIWRVRRQFTWVLDWLRKMNIVNSDARFIRQAIKKTVDGHDNSRPQYINVDNWAPPFCRDTYKRSLPSPSPKVSKTYAYQVKSAEAVSKGLVTMTNDMKQFQEKIPGISAEVAKLRTEISILKKFKQAVTEQILPVLSKELPALAAAVHEIAELEAVPVNVVTVQPRSKKAIVPHPAKVVGHLPSGAAMAPVFAPASHLASEPTNDGQSTRSHDRRTQPSQPECPVYMYRSSTSSRLRRCSFII